MNEKLKKLEEFIHDSPAVRYNEGMKAFASMVLEVLEDHHERLRTLERWNEGGEA